MPTVPDSGTCFSLPLSEDKKLALYHTDTRTQPQAQTSYLQQQPAYPPFDTVPLQHMPRRRESLTSNTLSAAFG